MPGADEPMFDNAGRPDAVGESDSSLRVKIQRLVIEQEYGVLCVQGSGQPYGALVAFAFSADLRHFTFATPISTRKYRLLSECNHVALVIDNRPNKVSELMEVEAVTATGHSCLLQRGVEFDKWAESLISRHPYLTSFVQAPTCALFKVEIVRFLHVVRFQEVRQWIPTDHS